MPPHTFDAPLSIQPMTPTEVETAIQWAQQEGWNPGIQDAQCFYQTDPDGFYAAKIGNEMVGSISLVKYGGFAFEGLVIVKPPFRGRGVGLAMQRFVNALSEDLNVGLDGVVAMQSKYEQVGFRFAHKNIRYAGTAQTPKSCAERLPIGGNDFQEVAAFDAKFFPAPRLQFLKGWLYQNGATALLMRRNGDDLIGYGVIRKCVVGHKIGPLFAENTAVAEALFGGLTSTVSGQEFFLDVPEPNAEAVALAERHGMTPVFATVRMYTKQAPSLPLEKIFGITSFELG
jgi:GNAT superfamily N-acetyltransferase